MRLAAPRPTRPREPVVPMINVVFLLLIFFLMAAVIAPPEPFGVTLPRAAADDPPATGGALHLGADGTLAYGTARGEAVFAALADHRGALELRADAALPAARLAGLMPRLGAAGIDEIVLVTVP
ncbi:MAG: biopolymer transporter ExbD [Rhodobacteraceae bacterium]|jgi:biopolymer transport protein ExbD|nr:biopolymer transporter ExbD [Paracoccaceae bacterium]